MLELFDGEIRPHDSGGTGALEHRGECGEDLALHLANVVGLVVGGEQDGLQPAVGKLQVKGRTEESREGDLCVGFGGCLTTQLEHPCERVGGERLDERMDGGEVVGVDAKTPARAGIRDATTPYQRNPYTPWAQGKDTAAWSAVRALTDPEAQGGEYYGPTGALRGLPTRRDALARTAAPEGDLAARVWNQLEELAAVRVPVGKTPRLPP